VIDTGYVLGMWAIILNGLLCEDVDGECANWHRICEGIWKGEFVDMTLGGAGAGWLGNVEHKAVSGDSRDFLS